jgi:hypothetical protein
MVSMAIVVVLGFLAMTLLQIFLAAGALAQTDKLFYILCDAEEAALRGRTEQVLGYMVSAGMMYTGNTIAELAQNCGVPLVASAHGSDITSVLRRPSILELHRRHTFGLYVGIRISSSGGFEYSFCTREEAEKLLEDGRDCGTRF